MILTNRSKLVLVAAVCTSVTNREGRRAAERDARRARSNANQKKLRSADARFRDKLIQPESSVREIGSTPRGVSAPESFFDRITPTVFESLRSSSPHLLIVDQVVDQASKSTGHPSNALSTSRRLNPGKEAQKQRREAEITRVEENFFAEGDNLTYREYLEASVHIAHVDAIASLPEIGDEFLAAVNASRAEEKKPPLKDHVRVGSKVGGSTSIAAMAAIAIFSLVTSFVSSVNSYFYGSQVPQISVPVLNDTGILDNLEGSNQRFERSFLASINRDTHALASIHSQTIRAD